MPLSHLDCGTVTKEDLGKALDAVFRARYAGVQRALGRAIGVSDNHIGRIVKDLPNLPRMEVETCLRIADVLDLPAAEVLRADGHEETAGLIERAFGPNRMKRTREVLRIVPSNASDLATPDTAPAFVALPLLSSPIAAGIPLVITGDVADYIAFREKFTRQFVEPIALRVGKKEDSMFPTIQPNDIIVIDQDADKRTNPRHERIYALNIPSGDLVGGTLKRVRVKRGSLMVLPENPRHEPDLIDLQGRPLTEVIVGECVWIGRTLEGGKAKP